MQDMHAASAAACPGPSHFRVGRNLLSIDEKALSAPLDVSLERAVCAVILEHVSAEGNPAVKTSVLSLMVHGCQPENDTNLEFILSNREYMSIDRNIRDVVILDEGVVDSNHLHSRCGNQMDGSLVHAHRQPMHDYKQFFESETFRIWISMGW